MVAHVGVYNNNELCTLKRWIVWCVNYISIKILKKRYVDLKEKIYNTLFNPTSLSHPPPPLGNYHLCLLAFHMLIPTFLYTHRNHRRVYKHFFLFWTKISHTLHRSASAAIFNLTMHPGHISEAAHVKFFHYL